MPITVQNPLDGTSFLLKLKMQTFLLEVEGSEELLSRIALSMEGRGGKRKDEINLGNEETENCGWRGMVGAANFMQICPSFAGAPVLYIWRTAAQRHSLCATPCPRSVTTALLLGRETSGFGQPAVEFQNRTFKAGQRLSEQPVVEFGQRFY